MSPHTPEEIVSSIRDIGTLPQSMAAILEILDDPNSDASDIGDIISRDVSLTARMLKMVNSVQYSRSRKVSKISEAVMVMGLNSVKVLALSSSLFSIKPDEELFGSLNIKRIWRHFIETASCARSIAESIAFKNTEDAFVAGVMHDIGIVAMILFFREKYFDAIKMMKENKTGVVAVEKEMFGMTHCEVGVAMAKDWKLPSGVSFVVENHHSIDPPLIVPEDSMLCNIVSLADRIALGPFEYYHASIEEDIRDIKTLCGRMKLSTADANRIRKASLLQSIILSEHLELDTGEVMEVLTVANSRLADMYLSLEKIIRERDQLLNEAEKIIKESTPNPV